MFKASNLGKETEEECLGDFSILTSNIWKRRYQDRTIGSDTLLVPVK